MRSGQRVRHIRPRVCAGVDNTSLFQSLPRAKVGTPSLGLHIGREGASDIWPFLPVDAQPGEVVQRCLHKLGAAARGIEILYTQDKGSTCRPRTLGGERKGAGMTDVKESCGRRRQAPAIGGPCHAQRGLPVGINFQSIPRRRATFAAKAFTPHVSVA